jgi:putative AdoMet-dependent methyltransferase
MNNRAVFRIATLKNGGAFLAPRTRSNGTLPPRPRAAWTARQDARRPARGAGKETGMDRPAWFHDEMRHAGVDYSDPAQVDAYDRRHQKFRDYRKDAEAVVRRLGLTRGDTVVDLGCGTGAFALHAAPFCKTVYAVDVSPVMLDCCRRKAETGGIRNIVFRRGGFLTYEHAAEPADAAVSVAVLHHLPDFWKLVGLRRVNAWLKPGGRFYLFDIVFPGAEKDLAAPIGEFIDALKGKVGPEFAAEAETHIREEYSTYDWILEGMLARAGFRIGQAEYGDGFAAAYWCTKSG